MNKYSNVNLEPLGSGVILTPIEVKESLITTGGIITKNTQETTEFVWRGECEVIKVGPEVTDLKPGDKVFLNMRTSHKIAFEHKGHNLLWTLAQAIFAKIV